MQSKSKNEICIKYTIFVVIKYTIVSFYLYYWIYLIKVLIYKPLYITLNLRSCKNEKKKKIKYMLNSFN